MYCDVFMFHMPVRIHFKHGASLAMADYIDGNQVLILISHTLYKNGTAEAIEKSLSKVQVTFFHEIETDPTTACVQKAVLKAKELQATTIIGIGGGSCLDVAKAVACLATSSVDINDYLEGNSVNQRKLKLILVPTTAGTGSEVTNVGVYTNTATGEKIPVVSPYFYADDAVIDPSLTYTMPSKVTANTGMDAFCHALEAYWNLNSNPISDELAVSAMKLILKHLSTVYHQPAHEEARNEMMLASLLAGIAFAQTRTTGAHALSYPLSALFHCTHGEACAITLPAWIKISHELADEKMKKLEKELGYENEEAFASAVENLLMDIHMPVYLSSLGVEKKDVDVIAAKAMRYQSQLALTPAKINEGVVKALILSILSKEE